ncbi:hypothetical protein ACRQ1B_23255 [Rhizobium panacihumi]|uniref:hypothetical protein n=1 Tax=Rhizobium panacihumi TaxID=2008450 RepID=UPI003D7B09EC
MACSTCAEFSSSRPIHRPADLTSAILSLQAAIADGRLTVLPDDITNTAAAPFSTLIAEGPWHDFVENRFKCTACGKKYRLRAETYHGSGGSLEGVYGI